MAREAPNISYSYKGIDYVKNIDKQDEFILFVELNRELLFLWLLVSNVSYEAKTIQIKFEKLVKLIDQINDQINELFLAWKIQYGLTEDEMNRKDLYFSGW